MRSSHQLHEQPPYCGRELFYVYERTFKTFAEKVSM
jgi:hypothetical protein